MNTKKRNHDFDNIGDLLLESVGQALEHAEGKITLKTETLSLPPRPPQYNKVKIKKIREKLLEVSQPVFAAILGVSPSAVKSWERGENIPNGAIRRLLQVIEQDPAYFLESIVVRKKIA